MLKNGSIKKAIGTLALASALIIGPQYANSQENTSKNTSNQNLETKLEPAWDGSHATDKELLEVARVVYPYFEKKLNSKVQGIKAAREYSNEYETENIYMVLTLHTPCSPDIPPFIVDKDKDMVLFFVNCGIEEIYEKKIAALLQNKSELKTQNQKNYALLLKREFKDFVEKDLSDKEVFKKFASFYGGTTDEGSYRENFLKGRLQLADCKKGYNIAQCKERELCAGILNGRTLENLGNVYNLLDNSSEEYTLLPRIDNYLHKKNNNNIKQFIENGTADEIKQRILDYLKEYYPEDFQRVIDSKDLVPDFVTMIKKKN